MKDRQGQEETGQTGEESQLQTGLSTGLNPGGGRQKENTSQRLRRTVEPEQLLQFQTAAASALLMKEQ